MTTNEYFREGPAADGRILRRASIIAAWVCALLAAAIYFLTAESAASFWDCPEYIANGAMLEPGHPPGNPTWMLAARMAAILAPSPDAISLCINLSSGLFTALATLFLALSIGRMLGSHRVGNATPVSRRHILLLITAQCVGSLAFALCDTAWFSAVEAEVYASSIFCTALCVWISLKWADDCRKPHSDRWLVLLAYITGLSIGVHQLNLLCLPAVALIILFGFNRRRRVKPLITCLILLFSLFCIACILFGMMPGMIALAQMCELLAVNSLRLPFHTGAVAYIVLAFSILTGAIATMQSRAPRPLKATMLLLAFFASGLFSFGGNILLGGGISLVVVLLFLSGKGRSLRIANLSLWCTAFLMLGFSTYITLIIRANANPPMNEGSPSDIFAFGSYLGRDQYGSRPLLHGRTPNSTPLRREKITVSGSDTTADYSSSFRLRKTPRYVPGLIGAKIANRSGFISAEDSALTRRLSDSFGSTYLVADYNYEYRYAPELNMWLPRIVSSDPDHLEAYQSWIGMEKATMLPVKASEAVDSLGNAVGKLDTSTGKRSKRDTYRPTYLQNLEVLASYQLSYMYMRYLLWNFVGRQNFIPSQGQIDAGNFITGFDAIDDAMLGRQGAMPPDAGKESRGRNAYYLLPLLLGVAGIVFQANRGRRGERELSTVGWLFLMTGIAIVIYLNQTPCEPRERDYSFVGSFWAFAIWIGYGGAALVRGAVWLALRCRLKPRLLSAAMWTGVAAALAVPGLMLAENYDDHDRSGRTVTADFAYDTLIGLEPDAILFVNGDNFTFPLWYAQEVLGVRRDVRVVNLAYLNSAWYPGQLMTQAYESAPLPMTARRPDIAYGAFSTAIIPSDTIATDAREAFRKLYSLKGTSSPRFPSGRIRIPASEGRDSIIVDLRAAANGRSYLSQQNIILLDIISTNAYTQRRRPIYWSAALPDSHKASLARRCSYAGMTLRLTDTIADHTPDNPTRLADQLLTLYRFGGLSRPGTWTDDPGDGQVRMLRRAIRITASEMLDAGRAETALRLLQLQLRELPSEASQFAIYSDRYLIVDEAVATADLLARCADALGRPELRNQARDILRTQIERLASWRAYLSSLPKGKQGLTSPYVPMSVKNLYAPIDAYLRLGGKESELRKIPQLRRIDMKAERADWLRYSAKRALLRDARYPESDSLTQAHLDSYLRLGGKLSELRKYVEFKEFPFSRHDTSTQSQHP